MNVYYCQAFWAEASTACPTGMAPSSSTWRANLRATAVAGGTSMSQCSCQGSTSMLSVSFGALGLSLPILPRMFLEAKNVSPVLEAKKGSQILLLTFKGCGGVTPPFKLQFSVDGVPPSWAGGLLEHSWVRMEECITHTCCVCRAGMPGGYFPSIPP